MRVPNVNIILRSQKRHSSVKCQPRWYAEMYRRVWGNRLDSERGLEIVDIDPTHHDVRYSEYADVGAAERMTIAYFAHGDAGRMGLVTAMFNDAFPNGLRPVIEKLLREDLDATRKRMLEATAAPVAHPSFLAARLTEVEALALQKAGFANINEVDTDDLIRLGECGLGAESMSKIIDAQRPMERIVAADPLVTSGVTED